MTLLYDGVSVTVEIAFASDPLATSPTWTDVTAYVRDIPSVFRGRASEFADFAPGTATVVLDNRDRRFDPDYASGAYYPNVVPMKRLKITWAFGVSSGLVFTGFVLGWPQTEQIGDSEATVTITAVDGTRFQENTPLASSAYYDTIVSDSPVAYWPMQDESSTLTDVIGSADWAPFLQATPLFEEATYGASLGAPVGDSDGAASSTTSRSAFYETSSLGHVNTLEFYFDIDGDNLDGTDGAALIVSTRDTTSSDEHELTVFFLPEQLTIDSQWYLAVRYYDAGDGKYKDTVSFGSSIYWIGMDRFFDGRPHHFALTVNGTTSLDVYVDGQLELVIAMSTGGTAPTDEIYGAEFYKGATVGHVALYSTALTGAQILDHYTVGAAAFKGETTGERVTRVLDEIGWPAGLRSIDTGDTYLGTYRPASRTAMDYLRELERTEQGLLFFDVDGNLVFQDRDTRWTATSVATLSDDGAGGAVKYTDAERTSDIDTIRNVVTATWERGAITRRNTASITSYGEARETIDASVLPTGRAASTLAAYVIRERKDPTARVEQITAPLRISTGDNEAETLLAVDLGDRVTWERTPVGISPQVAKTLQVQGIGHRIGVSRWDVTLFTSPQTDHADAPYLTMGDATYGQIGATAGNLVPY